MTISMALLLVPLAMLVALAFWQDHIFLYLLVCGPLIGYGLYLAIQNDPFTGTAGSTETPIFMIGAAIGVVGLFCLFRGITMVLGKVFRRR